jgi:septum formation topological specificity factor MinE
MFVMTEIPPPTDSVETLKNQLCRVFSKIVKIEKSVFNLKRAALCKDQKREYLCDLAPYS